VDHVRSLASRVAAGASVAGAVGLIFMAVYAATHPQVVPVITMSDWTGPDPSVVAENQGAVQWPALVAILALVAAIAVLRRPDRLSYLFVGALGAVIFGIALTMPAWLSALAPLATMLGLVGLIAVAAAVAGWIPSDPLPDTLPGWPEHHGGI
jgi:hypothetical protein